MRCLAKCHWNGWFNLIFRKWTGTNLLTKESMPIGFKVGFSIFSAVFGAVILGMIIFFIKRIPESGMCFSTKLILKSTVIMDSRLKAVRPYSLITYSPYWLYSITLRVMIFPVFAKWALTWTHFVCANDWPPIFKSVKRMIKW